GYPYREPIKGFRALAWVMVKALSGGMGVWLAADKYVGSARKQASGNSLSPSWLAPMVTIVFNGLLCAHDIQGDRYRRDGIAP
ncbi:hypothetical protein AB9F35_33485, partial [Rhizobium leguminosarum]